MTKPVDLNDDDLLAVKECSICGADYTSWGNNADPFEGRCCDSCNMEFVVPARIKRVYAAQRKEKGEG